MARPQTISTQRLLDVARRLFLEHGHSCPTAEIARAAGVSEGTLFKRFGTKAGLFQRAMDLPSCRSLDLLDSRVGQGCVRDNIATLANDLIAYFRVLIPTVLRLKASPEFDPRALFLNDPATGPHLVLEGVTRYLLAECTLGRLRRADPEVMAHALVGSVHSYVFFEFLSSRNRTPTEVDGFVRRLVEVLWSGIAPSSPKRTAAA